MVLHKMRGSLSLGNLCTVIDDEGGRYLDVALRPFQLKQNSTSPAKSLSVKLLFHLVVHVITPLKKILGVIQSY